MPFIFIAVMLFGFTLAGDWIARRVYTNHESEGFRRYVSTCWLPNRLCTGSFTDVCLLGLASTYKAEKQVQKSVNMERTFFKWNVLHYVCDVIWLLLRQPGANLSVG